MYYCILAEGFEEIEALTVTDVLRRAGVSVKNASVSGEYVTGAHGITVKSDCLVKDALAAKDAEGVILPGGMPGTINIKESAEAKTLIKGAFEKGLLTAAICAAPSVLGEMGVLSGKRCTCYPGFEDKLKGGILSDEKVVADGNVITSRGPGTALLFALELVRHITGKDTGALSEQMIFSL